MKMIVARFVSMHAKSGKVLLVVKTLMKNIKQQLH